MNKLLRKFTYLVGITAALMAAGCSDDIDPEITTLETSRLFSPVDLTALVVNRTAVRLEWQEVNNADSYTIEFFENGEENYSGTAVKIITGITFEELPYTVPGFFGETDYSVRVKAVGEGISDSKWIGTTFTTDPEQIFYDIILEEIKPFSVTLRWPAGEVATTIMLTPGDIVHTVTADEIAAGVAEITGLTSETEYTAKLMNGTRTRGTLVFKTAIDIGDAILVEPGDDLKALVEAANSGDTFALMPGEYNIAGDINISTSVGIVGVRPYDKPVIYGAILRINGGAGIRLKDVVMDGTTSDGNQTIVYNEDLPAGVYGPAVIENCVVRNYTKGVFYVSKIALIESVTITGTTYYNIECSGGDFIDFRQGLTRNFVFTNNTAYDSALSRDFFRMDAGGSTNFPGETSVITVTNNTFNNVATGTKRIFYVRLASHAITCNKNIFANTEAYYTNQSATTIVEMLDNNYHNAPNFISSTITGAQHDPGVSYYTYDPGFVDPANGDFTVTSEDVNIYQIGDPRWLQ